MKKRASKTQAGGWAATKRKIIDDLRPFRLRTHPAQVYGRINALTELADAARTDDESHKRLLHEIAELVKECTKLGNQFQWAMPLAAAKLQQEHKLANKKGRVSTAEQREVLTLNKDLRAAFPLQSPRTREIAKRLNIRERRVRYIIERSG
jgi:hypothetical protein